MLTEDRYKLCCNQKYGAFIAEFQGDYRNGAAILRGEESVATPMAFRHHMGGRVYDWVATSDFYFILISARLQQVLRDGGFTGWQTIPAVVEHNKRGLLEGYGCLVITGRTGRATMTESPLEQRPNPFGAERPHMVRVGLRVDFRKWDGSDIVVPEVGVDVLVSRAVKDALVKARITGVEFTRLDQYEATDDEATRQLWKETGYE